MTNQNQNFDSIVQLADKGTTVNLSAIARKYVDDVVARPGGYVQLSCECGHGDVVLDRLASQTDVAELVDLLQHALFDHISARRIEQTRICPELSVADLGVGAYGVTATTSATATTPDDIARDATVAARLARAAAKAGI